MLSMINKNFDEVRSGVHSLTSMVSTFTQSTTIRRVAFSVSHLLLIFLAHSLFGGYRDAHLDLMSELPLLSRRVHPVVVTDGPGSLKNLPTEDTACAHPLS